MEAFSRLGVFISMTFGGETLSLAAAKATIGCLRSLPVYEHIWSLGARLQDGFNALAERHGLPARLTGLPPKMLLQVNDEHGQRMREPYYLLLQELIKRGVLTNSTFMVSWCHSQDDIDHTLGAAGEALDILARAWREETFAELIQGQIPSGVSIVQEARR
jgi:glutamate-1-semialdehyde aminotransferase